MIKIHKIVNAETGEVIENPYSKEEIIEYEFNLKIEQKEKAEAEAKAQAKAAAQAKLAALGLTISDLEALGL